MLANTRSVHHEPSCFCVTLATEEYAVLACANCRYAALMDSCPNICGADDAFIERNAGRMAYLRTLAEEERQRGSMVLDRRFAVETLRREGLLPARPAWTVVLVSREGGAPFVLGTFRSRDEAERRGDAYAEFCESVTLVEQTTPDTAAWDVLTKVSE